MVKKMPLLLLALLLIAATPLQPATALNVRGPLLKSQTFLSPPILLLPGSVSNKYYLDIPFPRGHLALKSFNAEVVDERGAPVPLHETYLHHWVVEPYYAPAGSSTDAAAKNGSSEPPSRVVMARNAGVCANALGQYYGLGSETRRTATWVPDPYGVEVGGQAPAGHDQRWLLNVHAIDTRAAVDRLGCTECRCALYNVSVDEHGRAIGQNYTGGLRCCYDDTRCAVDAAALARGEREMAARKVFLRYTVTWQDWSPAVRPVRIYIFDVTDTALLEGKPAGTACRVEYEVEEEACGGGSCVHVLTTKQVVPRGGDLVYGMAHQHAGGIAASLHGDDGRLLCESVATYGDGEEPGNEAGYIVGMSTCYPTPGSVRVRDGEALTVVSNYSSDRQRTGVMGLFYILVADHVEQQQEEEEQQKPGLCFSFPVSWCLPSWLSSSLQ